MDVTSSAKAQPFTTKDGSTIRELHHTAAQSLAEASLEPDGATERHFHRQSEEIYFVLEGTGEMELDGERRTVRPGDAILIPPGAWHQIRSGGAPLRFLCACAPPYGHDDTFFE
jgi:mannose-6-phosphate isomerase-like protein (cupin superfamily)